MLPQHAPSEGRRHAVLSTLLIIAVRVIFVGAVIALLLPESMARPVATAVVALLLSVPILRLCWFGVRWIRRGDPKYAAIVFGLLCTIALGAALNYFLHATA